jgi:hypothetical protein
MIGLPNSRSIGLSDALRIRTAVSLIEGTKQIREVSQTGHHRVNGLEPISEKATGESGSIGGTQLALALGHCHTGGNTVWLCAIGSREGTVKGACRISCQGCGCFYTEKYRVALYFCRNLARCMAVAPNSRSSGRCAAITSIATRSASMCTALANEITPSNFTIDSMAR